MTDPTGTTVRGSGVLKLAAQAGRGLDLGGIGYSCSGARTSRLSPCSRWELTDVGDSAAVRQ